MIIKDFIAITYTLKNFVTVLITAFANTMLANELILIL